MGPGEGGAVVAVGPAARRVLLIEDDPGDALLVEELLVDADEAFAVEWVTTLAAAEARGTADVSCIVVDLGLPDGQGLDALERVLGFSSGAAVVVLTGLDDRTVGLDAVAAGAQDYLVKGEPNGLAFGRSLRYAIERRRADEAHLALREAEVRRAENLRLERGLLARPLVSDPRLQWTTVSRPGRGSGLFGGDFYDAVELDDGTLRLVLGDVVGHGPDEAALGVLLRVAWRTLVLAGHDPQAVLAGVDQVLSREPLQEALYATVCDVTIPPDRRSMAVRLAGHPAPVLVAPEVRFVDSELRGPPVGVLPVTPTWPVNDVDLPPGWELLLFTDGLYEGRQHPSDPERMGIDRVPELIVEVSGQTASWAGLPAALVERAEARHGGPLPDDVTMILLRSVEA